MSRHDLSFCLFAAPRSGAAFRAILDAARPGFWHREGLVVRVRVGVEIGVGVSSFALSARERNQPKTKVEVWRPTGENPLR